jgi:lipopolysaccharide export system protein LptA
MKPSFTSLLLLVVLFFFGGAAQAEKADRDKPMNIEADAMRYDDLNQTSVWTGRVLLNKGTLQIRADRLDVREDAQGYQYGVATALGGKRAFYRQKREGVDEFIEGEGEVIEYDGRADIVKFIKKAQLRRYRGATLADDMNGALIVYNNTTSIFTVDGSPSQGPAATPGGRVRAVLTPKRDPLATPATPAASAAPAPVLRPSTTLSGEKK